MSFSLGERGCIGNELGNGCDTHGVNRTQGFLKKPEIVRAKNTFSEPSPGCVDFFIKKRTISCAEVFLHMRVYACTHNHCVWS
jgi:hypothetical protein